MSESQFDNFLGLDPELADIERAAYAVLPIPYDGTVSFLAGTRHGPAAIIEASQQVELYDDELGGEFYHAGVATLPAVDVKGAYPAQVHERIVAAASPVIESGKFLIGFGGEHSVTSGLFRAARQKHRALSVLQIDAHLDLRYEYDGTPFSHASVMRRVVEMGAEIVPVGIRNVCAEEAKFLQNGDITPIYARDCHGNTKWQNRVLKHLGDTVYVTIDIDGFDPAYAPGTGTPEPGGLDWYGVTGLLRRVFAEKRVVAADIVEVIPIDGQAVTQFLAARLAYKMICYHQQKKDEK